VPEPLIRVARIDSTHGLRGEVSAQLCTDFPERFREIEEAWVGPGEAPESARLRRLDGWRLHKGKVLLKFRDVCDVDQARALAGHDVWIERRQAMELPEDTYYHEDLLGLEVYDTDGARIGEVEDILFTAGTDVLVVRSERGEILIPATRSICVQVDVEAGKVVVKVPEGLLEVNAR
jgi:16S rRNA processing protein RimM